MMIDALSSFGNCCTGSEKIARAPTSTMTRLTTAASTGWRMKMSVNERMGASGARSGGSVPAAAGAAGGGGGVLVHHVDEHVWIQLEGAGRGDAFTRLQSVHDHDVVAEHRAAVHRPQLRARLAVL